MLPQPSALEIIAACRENDVASFSKWKRQNILPNLQEVREIAIDGILDFWAPHEIAIYDGNAELLDWIMQQSGQTIDLTADACASVNIAIWRDHFDILKTLIEDYGMSAVLKDDENRLLHQCVSNGTLPTLRWLFTDCQHFFEKPVDALALFETARTAKSTEKIDWFFQESGLTLQLLQAVEAKGQTFEVPEAHLAIFEDARAVFNFLKACGADLQDAQRSAYLLAPTCAAAIQAGVIVDLKDLDKVLKTPECTGKRHAKL